jgi:hypothetical protein
MKRNLNKCGSAEQRNICTVNIINTLQRISRGKGVGPLQVLHPNGSAQQGTGLNVKEVTEMGVLTFYMKFT